MKRITKLFSLILSLILITVSVPMSVYSENTNQIENSEQITEIQEDLTLVDESVDVQVDLDIITQANELLEIEEPVDMAAVSSDYEHVTGIPDGIYAIETAAISSYYILSSQSSAYASCNSLAISPILMGMSAYFFKVTRVPDTDRYIIRSASDPTKTLCASGNNVVWIYISEDDSQVTENHTFNIIDINGTYRIKHIGTGKYICGNIGNLVASDSPENQVLPNWKFRGYRAYIEDGAYSFANVSNSSVWISTQNDSREAGAYIQQKTYDNCPIDSFSRGGMFKINRISNTDQYTIRLMTNNLLAWSFDGTSIVTENLPQNEADIPNSMRFYIAYDTGGYIIIPYGTMMAVSITDGVENLGTAYQISPPNTAKWNLYKYVGEPKHGIEILNSDDFISNGAIVGKTYNFNAVCWTTNLNFHTYFLALPSKYSDAAAFNWNGEDYTASLTVNKFTDMELYIGLYDVTNGSTSIYITDPINFRILLEEDVVYIQNKYSEKYATILGPSTDEGKIIHQYEYHEGTQIQWMIERDSYNPEYVLFKSLFSDKYMGVNPTNSNEIRQYSTIGDNTLWKIVELGNGSYTIINKAYENSGRVLATPSGASGNGQWLTQRAYVDDGDYSDEWNIYYIKYFATIFNYYDNGYVVRYRESETESQDNIQSYNLAVAERYMQLFGLSIGIMDPEYFESAIDVCKGDVVRNNVREPCTHDGVKHTELDEVIKNFKQFYTGNETTTMVLWTGHEITSQAANGRIEFNRSCSSGTTVYLLEVNIDETRELKSISVLMHELAHQYGAIDHYHEEDENGDCIRPNVCSKCTRNYRPESCIMNNSRQDITSEDIICEHCFQEILAHLNAHHEYS